MGQISFFNFGFVRGATKFVEGLQFFVSFWSEANMHLGIATPQKLVSPNKNHPNGEDPLVQVGEVSFFVTQIYHSLSFIALR